MNRTEELRAAIELERKRVDEMLTGITMEEAIAQSQRLDRLMEAYMESEN